MDFIDILKQFSSRVEKMHKQILTEEATKTSLIMPFFQQILGYDIFNPDEFVPEFTADVGIKKGEKVDYAIFISGAPTLLIEAKWCGEPLDKHDSQLFRYFSTTTAKFGILTNGIVYKFYTDLEASNKMDMKPFLEFNLIDIKESLVPELKRFAKSNFNLDEIFNSASELKYSNEIKNYFISQLKDPSDEFTKFILSNTYEGVKTQNVVDKFKPIIKKTLNNYISELMNEKITTALKTEQTPSVETEAVIEKEEEAKDKIITTDEELEAFGIIKGLLYEAVDPNSITYRDTGSYFAILFNGKVTKWICRIVLDEKRKQIFFPSVLEPDNVKDIKFNMESINELYSYKEMLINSVKRFI